MLFSKMELLSHLRLDGLLLLRRPVVLEEQPQRDHRGHGLTATAATTTATATATIRVQW